MQCHKYCKRFLFLLCILTLTPTLSVAAPRMGAMIQTTQFDGKQITLRILNTSNRDITAVSFAVVLTRTNGEMATFEYGNDYVSGIVFSAVLGHETEPGASHGIVPGDIRDIIIPAPEPNATYRAAIEVVVYADATADVLNKTAFQSILARRKGMMVGLQKANELMVAALANVNDPHPSLTVANQLKALAEGKSLTSTYEAIGLRDAEQNLRNTTRDAAGRSAQEDDHIRLLIKMHEQRISLISRHTVLVEGVPR